MKSPTFDSDGYPSDETLALISDWYNNNNWEPESFLIFAEAAFNKHYGKWEIIPNYNNDLLKDKPFTALRIATGGWSGNESVIFQMEKTVFWAVLWRASICGGLFIFDYDRVKRNN